MVSEHFRPTLNRVNAKPGDMGRVDGWTLNRYWAIKTDLEPGFLKKGKGDKTFSGVGGALADIIKQGKAAKTMLEVTDTVKLLTQPAVKLIGPKQSALVNVFYLAMFESSVISFNFYQEAGKRNDPIYARAWNDPNGEILGVIMPIKG